MLLDKIVKRILRRYIRFIKQEIDILRKKETYEKFNKIILKGQNTRFWGNEIFISDPSKLQLGENVHIGNNAYIKSEGGLKIGDNTHISRNLVLYTVNHKYDSDVLPYNDQLIKKEVVIGKNVWIGMNVCITPGTVIGDGCIIGMGTVVSGKVPPLTIIGSEKWRTLGKRDSENYNTNESRKRYGKENGLFYTSGNKTLSELDDYYRNNRTYIEIVEFKGQKALKKNWDQGLENKKSFENEKELYKKFSGYSWLPSLYEIGDNYIITEFIDNKTRLDKIEFSVKDAKYKEKILGDILTALLDMFAMDISHCDIHSKNIFVTTQGVKIIDFETAQFNHHQPDFFQSYDITGNGLESPYLTNNACILKEGEYSLKSLFEIENVMELKRRYENYLKEKLYDISNTFFTRKNKVAGRHVLRNRLIYSTFDLKYLKVSNKIGQRDVKIRLKNFGIIDIDIQDKHILDLGSNIGSTLFELIKMRPKSAIGIEYDEEKVKISNTIKNLHFKNHPIQFEKEDVESENFRTKLKNSYDVIFCLAVIEHLRDKHKFLNLLGEICSGTLYFEGNSGTDVSFIQSELAKAGFTTVKFMGYSNDEQNISNNIRPLFIAKK